MGATAALVAVISAPRLCQLEIEVRSGAARWNHVPVTGDVSGGETEFLLAGPEQLADVLMVLDEAAAWLQGRGIAQWPPRFEASWVEASIGRGETWLATVGGTVSATVTLDLADPVWEGTYGSALYVHRMAVRRPAAGLGAVILVWAARMARERRREALRLDCVAANTRLRAYYEQAGFAYRGDVSVAGAPGQRLGEGPVTVVSRYELGLTQRRGGLSSGRV